MLLRRYAVLSRREEKTKKVNTGGWQQGTKTEEEEKMAVFHFATTAKEETIRREPDEAGVEPDAMTSCGDVIAW